MTPTIGEEAPYVALPTSDGGEVRSDDLRGRTVVLVFLRWLG